MGFKFLISGGLSSEALLTFYCSACQGHINPILTWNCTWWVQSWMLKQNKKIGVWHSQHSFIPYVPPLIICNLICWLKKKKSGQSRIPNAKWGNVEQLNRKRLQKLPLTRKPHKMQNLFFFLTKTWVWSHKINLNHSW
jgi:hypothetical protein